MVCASLVAASYSLTISRFMFLGNHFNYSSQVLSIATKVAVQQAVFTPVFNSYCKLFRSSETRISTTLRYPTSEALIEFEMDSHPYQNPETTKNKQDILYDGFNPAIQICADKEQQFLGCKQSSLENHRLVSLTGFRRPSLSA
jgi:hypothetical protein